MFVRMYRNCRIPRRILFLLESYARGIHFYVKKIKKGDAMITYQDLFLFCTFIVALVGLCYTIFKGRKK